MIKTLEYYLKSAEQELDEVVKGIKPGALGFWDQEIKLHLWTIL